MNPTFYYFLTISFSINASCLFAESNSEKNQYQPPCIYAHLNTHGYRNHTLTETQTMKPL